MMALLQPRGMVMVAMAFSAWAAKEEVWIMGTMPLSGPWPGGIAFPPAIDMALEEINGAAQRAFTLKVQWSDSQCSRGAAIKVVAEKARKRNFIGLLGDACSGATGAEAELGPLWQLFPVSNGAANPDLNNRVLYPYHVRVGSNYAAKEIDEADYCYYYYYYCYEYSYSYSYSHSHSHSHSS